MSEFYRCVLAGDDEDFESDFELYLESFAGFSEVWKMACDLLSRTDYMRIYLYRPSDDALCYEAFKSGCLISGRFCS